MKGNNITIEEKLELIRKTLEKDPDFKLCQGSGSFNGSFTVEGDKINFWYDDLSHSTHLVSIKKNAPSKKRKVFMLGGLAVTLSAALFITTI